MVKWLMVPVCCLLSACGGESKDAAREQAIAPGVKLIGRIENPHITESSGLVASHTDTNVFWTHNDGGGKRQSLYAITRFGKSLGEFRVTGAVLEDWEDIASDSNGNLYIADIGNNEAKPRTIAVYQVKEPNLKAGTTGVAPVTRSWGLHYPERPFDCESFVVLGESGYLISKVFDDQRAAIYRFALTNDPMPHALQMLGEVHIDSPVTGADVSADGKLLGVVAKNGAYVFRIDGDMTRAMKGKPFQTKFKHEHIEACAFVPEGLLATAESREIYLFTDEAFRLGPPKKR